jgi:hypothetical protein
MPDVAEQPAKLDEAVDAKPHDPPKAKTNRMAMAALLVGVLGLAASGMLVDVALASHTAVVLVSLFTLGAAAVVTGAVALRPIRSPLTNIKGDWLALVGIVCGSLLILAGLAGFLARGFLEFAWSET